MAKEVLYIPPEKAVANYRKYKKAEEFWTRQAAEPTSKYVDRYLDKGIYKFAKDTTREKERATRRAEEFEDPSVISRFYAPDDIIDEKFRRQKGKKKKPVRKRRKVAKKKMSRKNRKKK